MKKFNTRKLSDNELAYICAEDIAKPYFTNIVEYSTTKDNIEEVFNYALKHTLEKYVELNIDIKNKMFVQEKRDYKVIPLDMEYNGDNLDEIMNKLKNSEPIQIYNVGNKALVFRFHHSYIDAKGAQLVLNTFFSYIVGIEDNIQTTDYISEMEYIKGLNTIKKSRNISYSNSLIELSKSKENRQYYKRATILKPMSFTLGKIITILNKYYKNDDITYMLPTNIRNLKPEIITLSNLTEILYIKCKKEDDWLKISKIIHKAISNGENLNIKNMDYGLALKLGKGPYKLFMKLSMLFQKRTNKFITGGSITSLVGNVNKYGSKDFKVNTIYTVPYYQPLLPLAISIQEQEEKAEVVLCSNTMYIQEELADRIIDEIGKLE